MFASKYKNNMFNLSANFFSRLAKNGRYYNNFNVPKLAVVESLISHLSTPKLTAELNDSCVVALKHNLVTYSSVIDAWIRLGVHPGNIHTTGKVYSTSTNAVNLIKSLGVNVYPDAKSDVLGNYDQAMKNGAEELWEHVIKDIRSKPNIKKILVADHGGSLCKALESIPDILDDYPVVVIEHTSAGLFNPCYLPIYRIGLATAAIKKQIEPFFIAETIVEQVDIALKSSQLPSALKEQKQTFGVIGNGAIGEAIIRYLSQQGYKVYFYDGNNDRKTYKKEIGQGKIVRLNGIESVISNANYIFGCTGTDITADIKNIDLLINQHKYFFSCSSSDIEFNSLLKSKVFVKYGDNDLLVQVGDKLVLIKNKGFPINFTGSQHSVNPKQIQLTRGMSVAAICQAAYINAQIIGDGRTLNEYLDVMLDPNLQKIILSEWAKDDPEKSKIYLISNVIYSLLEDSNIAKQSGGELIEIPELYDINADENIDSPSYQPH